MQFLILITVEIERNNRSHVICSCKLHVYPILIHTTSEIGIEVKLRYDR